MYGMIEKPKSKKKKKIYNGYKEKSERCCHYCGTPYAERHEAFGGSNRQFSIEDGFQVDLCPNCHRRFHEKDEWGKEESLKWKIHFQGKYENKLTETGITEDQARTLFISRYGRNYI